MRHCRLDYEAIQPWPVKRPHYVKAAGVLTPLPEGALTDPDLIHALEAGDIMPIIPDDEPVFILRAKDITAPDVLDFWVRLNGQDVTTALRVQAFAQEMRAYAAEHYDGGKMADTPHDLLRAHPVA